MTLQLEDSTYTGYVLDGLPHAKGSKKWKDGKTYDGNFVKGKREGTGVCVLNNGDSYNG